MRAGFLDVLVIFSVVVTAYFVCWNITQVLMCPMAGLYLWRHRQGHRPRALMLAQRLVNLPLVSIVMPAFNEELTIVESVSAILALDYERREVVVVNDGSSDRTLERLIEAFHLVPAPVAYPQPIATAPIRSVFRSTDDPGLVVVDKENGRSKADASNAGINAATGPLVLDIDADTVLEPDALTRAVLPFLEDPATIAVGGNVAIINGGRLVAGRVVDLTLPRSWFARFQIVEYMRAFLLFRIACASINAVPIVSGAFGLFKRDALIAVGGYDHTAIGEDMDLTIRLHKHFRARGEPARIAFDPNPLAWTQAPEDRESLRSQRHRWRRGLLQVLWRHRGMIGNPRYGVVGAGSLIYVAVFEGLGPLIEVAGYAVTLAAALLGLLNWKYFWLLMVVSVMFGTGVTLLSLLLSDVATRRYMRGRDLARLVAVVVIECVGYRQLNSWWGCVGTVQAMTGKTGWGPMKRRAFQS